MFSYNSKHISQSSLSSIYAKIQIVISRGAIYFKRRPRHSLLLILRWSLSCKWK